MKVTDNNKPINTLPKGVWESSNPIRDKKNKNNNGFTSTTDLQGNGYPINKQSN